MMNRAMAARATVCRWVLGTLENAVYEEDRPAAIRQALEDIHERLMDPDGLWDFEFDAEEPNHWIRVEDAWFSASTKAAGLKEVVEIMTDTEYGWKGWDEEVAELQVLVEELLTARKVGVNQ